MRIQRFEMNRVNGIERFDGLSMVNLKPSKPSYPKVIKPLYIKPYIYQTLYPIYYPYRGIGVYTTTKVCKVSSLFPALLAGILGGRAGDAKPSYIKPLSMVYIRYAARYG